MRVNVLTLMTGRERGGRARNIECHSDTLFAGAWVSSLRNRQNTGLCAGYDRRGVQRHVTPTPRGRGPRNGLFCRAL
jgi:hypothetical protein